MNPFPPLEKTVKLVSFDVFDTLITRRCGSPENIFHLVGEKLVESAIWAGDAASFKSARIAAERRARAHAKSREITLADIYEELNAFWHFPQDTISRMVECELETERENIIEVPGALQMVKSAIRAGKRIGFVSDMYLPEEFLRKLLTEIGVLREQDPLYVSSQWGESKAGGGLYRIMLEREHLTPAEVVHVGDSRVVDVDRAVQLGIRAVESARGSLNYFESHLASANGGDSRAATLAGISRRARLETDESEMTLPASILGASVAAPLLSQYAEWVLRTTISRGLNRLYFLARDGQLLMELCQTLAPSVGAKEIKLHYLYGSREVWYPAALAKMDESAAEFFASQVAFAAGSWEECVALLGFDATELQAISITEGWAKSPNHKDGKRKLFLDLSKDPTYGPQLRQWLERQKSVVSRYILESGLVGGETFGLVDCGWSGRWTDIIGDLVQQQGGIRPEVFFLGQRSEKVPSRSSTLVYLYNHQSGSGLERIPDCFHVVIEFFLTADHGRTQGFKQENGKIVPVLAATDLQGFTIEEWRAFRRSVIRFAELYSEEVAGTDNQADLRQLLLDLISHLWSYPSRAEASLLGRHTIGLSPNQNSSRQLARAYKLPDLLRLAFRFRLPGYAPHWWHEGSLASHVRPYVFPWQSFGNRFN